MSVDDLTGQMVGPYRLDGLLGRGAMGAVYRGHQPALERDVAVKVLPSAMAAREGYLARFNREAKIAASLEHPHIVPLYDYGTDDGMSYLAMRLLTGGTLAERLNHRATTQGSLPSMSETNHLLRQIAAALDYAHRKGVVHRDIKPNNVMFDDEGAAYVVDFGIARLINVTTSITGEQMVFGTPHYMPPEQWRDQELTPETDQYALAVVIFSMVTGQPPFDAPTPHALMYKHFHEDAPLVSSLRPDLPPEVNDVLDRALSKTPGERFLTVGEFAQAFDAAISDVPARSTDFFRFPLPTSANVTQPRLARVPDAPAAASVATAQPPLEPVAPEPPTLPPPPVAAYPAPARPGPGAPPPARSPRKPRLSPLVAGLGLGLALLGLFICGGAALVASRLGGFERDAVETQPTTIPVTEAMIVLTAVEVTPNPQNDEPQPTRADVPTDLPLLTNADTPTALPGVGPIPVAGTAIAAANGVAVVEAATMAHGTEPVRGVAISPDGQVIATGAAGGGVYLWDSAGNPRGQAASGGGVVYSLAFSPNGRWMATGQEDSTVRLWDAASLTQVAVLTGHGATVRGVAFSPDSRYIASASEDETVRLWDVSTQSLSRELTGFSARALAVTFSPGGTRVAAASDDGSARVWDIQSGASVVTLSGGEQLRGIAFSPAGDRLTTSDADGNIRIWDAETGALISTLTGHNGEVWAVAYSPDGALLASGGRDNTARLWEAASGRELAVLRGHGGWVLGVAFSADGSQLITGGGDGAARLWDITGG